MTDEQLPPTEPAAEESAAGGPRADEGTAPDQHATTSQAREWLAQLQQMIDQVAAHAGPVARDVAAKAAELAAVAGEKAGPLAKRAADKTEEVGARVADRSRRFADETLLVMLHGLLCWLAGRRVPISRLDWAHPQPAHGDEYRRMFGPLLRFDAGATAIVFDARVLQAAVTVSAAELARAIDSAAGSAPAAPGEPWQPLK